MSWEDYDRCREANARRAAHTMEAHSAAYGKQMDWRVSEIERALAQLCRAHPDSFLGLDPRAEAERIVGRLG
jgi:hypothetical protein